MRTLRYALTLTLLVIANQQVWAQANAKVPDPDPELERKTFIVPEGFEVSLYAADPLLAKPIQMNFDPQGRLWVASSEVYPQIKPGEKARDKVLILEDTNRDGKADKTTIFAEGLLIPTGVAPGDGGAYVADSTDLVHFSDPDPETGKARKKRIVLSGFGTEDTHHIVHTFRWGPDGNLYFNQSIYIHSHIETPHGVRRLNAGGIWQFRPETMELAVLAKGFVNPWGFQFDRWGQTFATDGAYGEGINILMPGAYYVTNGYGVGRLLTGLNPGSPKHCGLEVLSGRHLPPEYQGNMITNDFRGHRVCRFVLREDGSGYQSQEKQELIKSTHPAFRPIDVAMGPDGAIYVADWYNPIIQHGEVDFRDPRRDHTHGRIWRITAKNRPLVPVPNLVGADVPALLEHLKDPEDWTRLQTKRVLKEKGKDAVIPALASWVAALDPKSPTFEHDRLEGLWTYQSLDVLEPKLLTAVLNGSDPRVRAAACRIVAAWSNRLPNALELLAARVADDNAQVRLDAVRALGQIPSTAAAVIAAQALDKPVDRWLDYGLWLTMRELAPQWLEGVRNGTVDFGGNPRHLIFALQSAGSGDVVAPLRGLLKAGKIAPERAAEVQLLLARVGGPAEMDLAIELANKTNSEEFRNRLLAAMEESVRQRKVGKPASADALAQVVDKSTGSARQAALRLVGLWKNEALRGRLEEYAKKKDGASVEDQQAALEGLAILGGPKSKEFLQSLAKAETTPAQRALAVEALAGLDLRLAAEQAVALLPLMAPPVDPSAIFAAFTQRKDGAAALSAALAGKKLPADIAKIGIRVAKAAGQPDAKLVDALTNSGGLTTTNRNLTGKDLEQFVADVGKLGDAARGEQVYRRAELTCQKCHGIAGAGGQVGPDLTSIGASAPVDYLVESLLNPNAKIKEGFHSLIVNLEDGRVVTGVKVRETKSELVVRDAEDREIVIPAADLASKKEGRSLMPEGLIDPLTRQEMLDLVRFLSELGKVGPYAASPGRVVRRWQAIQPTKQLYTIYNRDRLAGVAVPGADLNWVPAYSLVSGDLPLDSLPSFQGNGNAPKTAVVRCQIDVTTPGKLKLVVNDPAGLTVWLDGTAVDLADGATLDLTQGVRTITVAVNLAVRNKPLRLEFDDVPGAPTRARIVSGK